MDFTNKTPIYLQIVELFYREILENRWNIGNRIPSVREAAVDMEVNPNTMMRAYTHLQTAGIIFNRRGIGYFVSDEAHDIILTLRKKEFINNELPAFMRSCHLLGINSEELQNLINKIELK